MKQNSLLLIFLVVLVLIYFFNPSCKETYNSFWQTISRGYSVQGRIISRNDAEVLANDPNRGIHYFVHVKATNGNIYEVEVPFDEYEYFKIGQVVKITYRIFQKPKIENITANAL